MSYSKPTSYAFAVREMNYWKSRAQNVARGEPDPWSYNSSRAYRSPSYESRMEDSRWQDVGSRNDIPSIFGTRAGGSSNPTHLTSSNQVNSNLFGNFQSRSILNRNNEQFSPRMGSFSTPQSGRITRNSLVDFSRARRILQKRALNAVGSGSSSMLNSSNFKRRRGPRKPATVSKIEEKKEEIDKDIKTESKDKLNKSEKVSAELRLAIIWVNDTKAILNNEQATLLSKKLETILDELPKPEGGHVPRFYASGLSAGIYKLVCTDQETADWLKETVENLPELWEGSKFGIVQQSVLNALKHVSILLINCDDQIVTLLKRFEKQNPDVSTEKWRVHRETVEENRRVIVFAIDEESLDYLKKNEFKLFSGLRQVKFVEGMGKGLLLNK